jgi:thiopurine S-methyltransferase
VPLPASGGKYERFDAVWDRASIIAIEPHLREKYVETMSRVIRPGGTLLVSTLDRRTGTDEGRNSGPPFSVPEAEVRRLYEGQDWVESVTLVEETDQFAKSPADGERFSSSGRTSMYNLLFVIKAKV